MTTDENHTLEIENLWAGRVSKNVLTRRIAIELIPFANPIKTDNLGARGLLWEGEAPAESWMTIDAHRQRGSAGASPSQEGEYFLDYFGVTMTLAELIFTSFNGRSA